MWAENQGSYPKPGDTFKPSDHPCRLYVFVMFVNLATLNQKPWTKPGMVELEAIRSPSASDSMDRTSLGLSRDWSRGEGAGRERGGGAGLMQWRGFSLLRLQGLAEP